MRVLFSSTWGYGHVFPMVPLAQALLAAGHEVLWVTNEPACPLVADAGVPCVAGGLDSTGVLDIQRRNGSHMQRLAPRERGRIAFANLFAAWAAPAMTEDLLQLAQRWSPDLLVHEQAELASPLVGAILGLPSVTHAFGTAVPPATLTEAGSQLMSLWTRHGLALPPHAGCFRSLYLDICPPSVQSGDRAHIRDAQPLRPVPWTGPRTATLPPYLERDERPLVYLTLGTVQNHAPVMRPAVAALAALPVRVLATVGLDGNPDVLGAQPSNVTVARWVPQSQVFEHCDAVVSHAGSGTFLAALGAGLPQLCLPQAADQFRNTDAGVRTGAALGLAPEEATIDTIRAAVISLLEQPSLRAAALLVAREITAMPSPDDIVKVLVTLV